MVKINKKINLDKVPRHVAFIMDGNGRWAKARGWARTVGHEHGYQAMILAVKRCADLGIKVCSIFGFSTENWNRPKDEIDEIFRLIRENIGRDSDSLMEHGIKLIASGDTTRFPKDMQDKLAEVIEQTKNNTRCVLNLCINYGGRADITRAVNEAIVENKKEPSMQPITEQALSKHLYAADLPDPDLVVRTSGEQRISNFMLWQMAYSELLFIKTFWPAINERIIDKCVIAFQKRKRRFGKI